MAGTNFNYQVALKEGLKNLQQGRLRQAEHSFRYLVDNFPGAEGGYRGLAKVHFEQEDRASALRVLREGAVALTKSGERPAAIGLLREAVGLDRLDLGTHRRLAAALALAGDTAAAVEEYARYIRDVRDAGDLERARSEAAYAMGQLKGVPGVTALEGVATAPPVGADERMTEEPVRPAFGRANVKEVEPSWRSPAPAPSASEAASDPWAAPPPPPPAPPMWSPPYPAPAYDPWVSPPQDVMRGAPIDEPQPAGPGRDMWTSDPRASAPQAASGPAMAEPAPAGPAVPPGTDSEMVEAAAARYLATRDPRAAPLALEAARRYIADGHTDAASDLLLQLIAAGVADHDAQRLLVDVVRTLGKREVAKVKCQLLVQALRLDGRNDLAAEVEALAKAD